MKNNSIQLCPISLWNSSSLMTNKPDFTECFRKLILNMIPCLILLFYSPISVSFSYQSSKKNLNGLICKKRLYLIKMLIGSTLLFIELTSFFTEIIFSLKIYFSDLIKPIFLSVSFIFAIWLMYFSHTNKRKFSVLLTSFWSVLIICNGLNLRSDILNYEEISTYKQKLSFWLMIFSFVLSIAIWILSFFSEYEQCIESKIYPESDSSLISWLTFSWITKLIYVGYKKNINESHVWELDNENKSEILGNEIDGEWKKLIKQKRNKKPNLLSFFKRNTKISSSENLMNQNLNTKHTFFGLNKLGICLFKMHLIKIVLAGFLVFTRDIFELTGPLVLDGLIKFISNEKYSNTVGYFLVFLVFIRLVVMSMSLQHSYNFSFLAAVQTRSALMHLIYKKSFRLSTESKRKATTGEILNLMQVNTQIFIELSQYGHQVWSAPIKIIFCSILLWIYIGPAVLAGVATMVILVLFNSIFMAKYTRAESEKLKFKDSKMKILNEVLNGIKVIKFYGWEISFENMINKIRNSELKVLKKGSIFYSCFNFTFGFTSFMITFVSLLTFIYIDDKNVLTPTVAYVTLSLFNSIRIPMFLFGPAVSNLIQTIISLNRIQKFLLLEEIETDQISYRKNDDHAIIFEKANFSWEKSSNKLILRGINCEIPHQRLVAIVGKVGSGKSSILSSILGEMCKTEGNLNIDGSISYVPQQAWIQNATVRENIVFGNEFDHKYYNKIIQACSLETDLEILVAGDRTEIGEKGINLSGGQKQRISLARAVYNNSDIFLFDDPLSAVDAHVGKHIFQNVMGPNGLLKNKTRVLVTNSINFLPEVDLIFMLENGQIVESGNYNKLINLNGCFTSFINKSFVDETENENKDKQDNSIEEQKAESCEIKNEKDFDEDNAKIIEKENIESGNLKTKTIFEYFKACSFLSTFLFLFGYVLMNVFYAFSSFWLSEWTNANIEESGDKLDKGFRIFIYGLLGFSQNIFSFSSEIISVKMIMNSSRNLHQNMLESVMHSTMQFFESTPIGRILNRFSKDIINLEFIIPAAFRDFIYCVFDLITTAVVITLSTPLFLAVIVPISIIYVFIQRFYVASSSKLKRLDATTRSPIYSHFGETLNGLSTINAYNAQSRFINLLEKKINENNSYFYPSMVSTRWCAVQMEIIGIILIISACIFAVMAKGSISPGIIGLSISFALNISSMMRYGVKCASDLESNLTSVERIKEYCNTPQEANWQNTNYKPDDKWPENGEIKFIDYSVRYRQDLDFALKNINCHIKPSEKIGIVGRTGAGKSSLSLALFRLLERNDGEILIDNMNTKRMGLHDLRQKLTIIPQDPVLFSGTLRMNLDPFEQSTDKQIWNALEKAHLKTFVENLDKKLLFECSEGGENLSVGQRQLICLARALIRNSKILLLDEATAAIDHNTDDLVQETIRTAFSHCTMITIAHRLNTILDSDRIMVLDKGKIVEFDTPVKLLKNKNGLFYSMAKAAGIVNEF